jgi:hypothetical protein
MRTAEFIQLTSSKPEAKGDLPPMGADFFARAVKPKDGLPSGVAQLVVASKLREVVAQIGFTRLEPVSADLQGEYDLGVETAALGLTTNWLPASELRGEGVFIQFDENAVRAWEERPAVLKRGKQLLAGYGGDSALNGYVGDGRHARRAGRAGSSAPRSSPGGLRYGAPLLERSGLFDAFTREVLTIAGIRRNPIVTS